MAHRYFPNSEFSMAKEHKSSASTFANRPKVSLLALLTAVAINALLVYIFFY